MSVRAGLAYLQPLEIKFIEYVGELEYPVPRGVRKRHRKVARESVIAYFFFTSKRCLRLN